MPKKKLKFELDTDGNQPWDTVDDKNKHVEPTVVDGFDPNNPGATLTGIDDTKTAMIYYSQSSPGCVTIYINRKAYQV